MVNASLAGAHPLRNNCGEEVSRLADLLYILFEHYTFYSSPMAANFIQALRTLVGLGFTACLADKASITSYQAYLHRFLYYDEADFRQHPGALLFLAQSIANMITLAVQSLVRLPPRYHTFFMQSLSELMDNVVLNSAGKGKEAKQLVQGLQTKLALFNSGVKGRVFNKNAKH